MSGFNLDTLSDEQVDELIAGCRVLRAQRAQWIDGVEIGDSAVDPTEERSNDDRGRDHFAKIQQ